MADDKQDTLRNDLLKELRRINVPAPEAVLAEFNLLSISDEAEDLLRETAKHVNDRVDGYAKLLEDLLHADGSIATMTEITFFSEQDVKNITVLYRVLMRLHRSYLVADVQATEQAFTHYILDALAVWGARKADVLALVQRMADGWASDDLLVTEKSYFG